jgi:hypothetical protein
MRRGSVVAYDWGFEGEGQQHIQRSFVLLDDGVQINQPVIFPSRQQAWWYCDLVAHGPCVTDRWMSCSST